MKTYKDELIERLRNDISKDVGVVMSCIAEIDNPELSALKVINQAVVRDTMSELEIKHKLLVYLKE